MSSRIVRILLPSLAGCLVQIGGLNMMVEGWRLFAHIQEAPGDYNYDFYQDGIFYKFRGGSQVKVTYRDEDYNNYSGTVTVPATVTYNNSNYTVMGIGDYAFRDCGNLTKVNLPATIDSIGSYAFTYCSKLTEIDIPNGVTYIADGAFASCSTLKSIMFPAGVTKIYGSTCRGCYALETVWLPVNLTNIYAGSFSYCNAIKNIISLNRVAPDLYNNYVFSSVYENATLYIPEDAYGNTYTSTNDHWYNFTTLSLPRSPTTSICLLPSTPLAPTSRSPRHRPTITPG